MFKFIERFTKNLASDIWKTKTILVNPDKHEY